MSTNPKFWSDGFEIVDDPDSIVFLEDDLDEPFAEDDQLKHGQRHLTAWQRLEDRLGERRLHAELGDWDYWDEYLVTH